MNRILAAAFALTLGTPDSANAQSDDAFLDKPCRDLIDSGWSKMRDVSQLRMAEARGDQTRLWQRMPHRRARFRPMLARADMASQKGYRRARFQGDAWQTLARHARLRRLAASRPCAGRARATAM
jgi:hypothetical protein